MWEPLEGGGSRTSPRESGLVEAMGHMEPRSNTLDGMGVPKTNIQLSHGGMIILQP